MDCGGTLAMNMHAIVTAAITARQTNTSLTQLSSISFCAR